METLAPVIFRMRFSFKVLALVVFRMRLIYTSWGGRGVILLPITHLFLPPANSSSLLVEEVLAGPPKEGYFHSPFGI